MQHYFTNHRKPLPRVLGWTFKNPSLTKLGKKRNSGKITPSPSSSSLDTMATVDSPPTPLANTNGLTNGNHEGPVEPSTTFDPGLFRSYLLALLPPVVGATPPELEYLFEDDFNERVEKFAAEGGDVIYVVKKRDEVEGQFIFYYSCFSIKH